MKLLAAFLFCLLMTSCSSVPPAPLQLYTGVSKPLEEIASIDASSLVTIYSIDSKRVPAVGNYKGLHVLPGRHEFDVYVTVWQSSNSFSSTDGVIVADVEAGHTYTLAADADKITGWSNFRLIDRGTGYDQNCLVSSYPDHFDLRKNAKNCYGEIKDEQK